MLRLFIPAVVAICIAPAFAPPPQDDVISWNEDQKLTWADFRGKPPSNAFGDAATAIRISAKPRYEKKRLVYDVRAVFIPSKSWVRDESPRLLSHEQLHFDIAELYARKIRRKISEYERLKIRDVDVYNSAIREILAESNDVDEQYDRQTLHSSVREKQRLWNTRIELELKILGGYSAERWKPKALDEDADWKSFEVDITSH